MIAPRGCSVYRMFRVKIKCISARNQQEWLTIRFLVYDMELKCRKIPTSTFSSPTIPPLLWMLVQPLHPQATMRVEAAISNIEQSPNTNLQ